MEDKKKDFSVEEAAERDPEVRRLLDDITEYTLLICLIHLAELEGVGRSTVPANPDFIWPLVRQFYIDRRPEKLLVARKKGKYHHVVVNDNPNWKGDQDNG